MKFLADFAWPAQAPNVLRDRASFSTYLDLLRFTAALLVVLEHSVLLGILPRVPVLTDLSHESVVVFFVLSGLVIAASSLRPEMTWRDYIATRAARIYCVAVPALVVCYGVMAATRGAAVAQFTSSLFFLDGVWFNYGSVPFNGPYWSLCYEVWYYACWGVLAFAPRTRLRLAVAAAVLVAMGPAFATLGGIWLMGALLAVKGERLVSALRRLPRWLTPTLFALSLLGVLFLAASTLEDSVRDLIRRHIYGWWRMRGSEYALTDYAIGLLVAVHLAAALALFGDGRRLHASPLGRAIRYCAGFTFTLYLFHYPILLALTHVIGPASRSMTTGLGFICATLIIVWLIAFGTERQLPRWRRMMRRALDVFPQSATHGVTERPAAAGSFV
jgi:peptidoglycan/LPS O-acetylase OafA/YrhL